MQNIQELGGIWVKGKRMFQELLFAVCRTEIIFSRKNNVSIAALCFRGIPRNDGWIMWQGATLSGC